MPIGSVNCIREGMLGDELVNITPSAGGSQPIGYRIALRNQFFHGAHPLGWIRRLSLTMDGVTSPEQDTRFALREHVFPIEQMRQTSEIWWQPRELAYIMVRASGGAAAGPHEVSCHLEVSSFVFTPFVDRDDLYPAIAVELTRTLTAGNDGTALR